MMAANKTPSFWFHKPGIRAWALSPFAWIYSRTAKLKIEAEHSGEVDVPVLCVGNFIAGGGGKTPTALALAQAAGKRGLEPCFLSRGYGGSISGPALVDTDKHTAADVGDEPLLLARACPTVVCADRLAGARMLAEEGCGFIIMDDGFQNPRLKKDYALVVTDSRRGAGNGFTIPAGPLRLPLRAQIRQANAVLVIGEENAAMPIVRAAAQRACPVYQASLVMRDPARWKGNAFVAYSGIADPQRFFDHLRKLGADLAHVQAFGDHHMFTEKDASELLDHARRMEAGLVTTAKDHIRLGGDDGMREELAAATEICEVDLVFDNENAADRIIDRTIHRFEQRILRA